MVNNTQQPTENLIKFYSGLKDQVAQSKKRKGAGRLAATLQANSALALFEIYFGADLLKMERNAKNV